MGEGEPKKLHIAMFPWLAFGHIIPFLELSKQIAQKGHKITFISTPKNIQRMPKIPPDLAENINLISFNLPQVENLPQEAEATMDLALHKIPFLKLAYDGLQDSLAQFLENSTPDWIINDFAAYWLPPMAARLGVSCAFFSIFNAWTTSFWVSSLAAMINDVDERTLPEHYTVPPKWVPFPSKVVYKPHEAKRIFSEVQVNSSGMSDFFRIASVMAAGCDVIALRSCMELEADFIGLLAELHGKPAIPIGLLPPSPQVAGGGLDDTWLTISGWLDKQNKGSVVYVALGSELTLSKYEVTELALGLELSGLPFFWALRKQHGSSEGDSVELPEAFEERTKGRGVVWTSWAPQPKILAHESVGGFLTHCGCSSVIESFYFGRVLIMLPFNIDQGLNARVYEDKKVGIEVPRDVKDGSYTRNAIAETLRMVMVDEKGQTFKDKAKEMAKIVADKDRHDRYVDHFVEFLQNRRLVSRD